MADYFNNEDGTRTVIPVDPARVAALVGLREGALTPRARGRQAAA